MTLSWTSDAATVEYFHNHRWGQNTPDGPVHAVVFGKIDWLPGGSLNAVVEADPPVMSQPGALQYISGNDFVLSVYPDVQLAPGTYSGQLTVRIFSDAAHQHPVQVVGGTLPYQLTVGPELTIDATVDGVPAGTVSTSSSTTVLQVSYIGRVPNVYWSTASLPTPALTVHPGQVLTLQASLPVTWVSPDQAYPGGSGWAAPSRTATTLTQTIPSIVGDGVYVAMPQTGTQRGAGFVVRVAP